MSHIKKGVLAAFAAALLGLATTIGLQAPTPAEAAIPASSLTLAPASVARTIDYGETDTVSVVVSTNSASSETVSTIPVGSDISVTPSYTTVAPDAPQTFTVTLNARRTLSIGHHQLKLQFMPQDSRAAAEFVADVTIRKPTVDVTSNPSVELYYGQSVDASKVQVNTSKGSMSLAQLGVDCSGGRGLTVGTHQVALTATSSNYDVRGLGNLAVTVKQATPTFTNLKASNLTNGSKLGTSTITATARNPWNNEVVAGRWEWMSPDEVMRVSSGLTQTFTKTAKFTPNDNQNYMGTQANVAVTVLSSGGPAGGGTEAADPQLKVTGGSYTYDHSPHAPIVSTPSVGNKTITYTSQATGQSTTNPPVDAGTYSVRVDLAATMNYRAASETTTLTINPRLVNLKTAGAIQSRPYNGRTEATVDQSKILLDNIYREDGVGLTMSGVKANYSSPNVGTYQVVIQCLNASLTGAKAGNYRLNGNTVTETSTIFKRPAAVDFHGEMTKEYGETFSFGNQGSSYTIQAGTETGTSGVLPADARSINLSSAGASATASVGTYSVTALGAGANYDLKVNGNGSLRVTKATPQLVSASAGSGKVGAKLSSVTPPTVTYVNKYSHAAVPGTVTWTNPNQTIGGARAAGLATTASAGDGTYEYTFTPNLQGNYNSVTGTVTVHATAKTPVNITPTRTAFTYDGQPHEVSATSNTSSATVTTTYKVNGSWVSKPPVDVGLYDFKITADLPDNAEYADNEIDGKLTISPLTPTGQPKVSGDGTTLSAYKLDGSGITGIGRKAVSGTVSWDNPSATVKAGDKYAWTFTSSDQNYGDAHGTIIPKQLSTAEKVDKSKLENELKDANVVLASAQVSSNGLEVPPNKQWVTNSVNDVLLSAIGSANSCMTEGGATQKMVDVTLANLTTAVNSFKASMQPGLQGTDKEAIEKKPSSVVVASQRHDAKPGDVITVKVSGEGNGAIFAASDNDAVATATASGDTVTIGAICQGTATVVVSRSATDTYDQGSVRIGVVVGEAPADYVPPTEEAVDATQPVTPVAADPMVRVRNPYTNEHLFVKQSEANSLVAAGWESEGKPAKTAEHSSTPVYRLYNQWSGEHHYTSSLSEFNGLKAAGWTPDFDGQPVFYSDDAKAVQVYRLWNGQAGVGSHHYTEDVNEYNTLINQFGWKPEGIGWYYAG